MRRQCRLPALGSDFFTMRGLADFKVFWHEVVLEWFRHILLHLRVKRNIWLSVKIQ